MIEIVLVVCLASAPTACRDERPLLEVPSLVACLMHGQMAAQRWLDAHPAWHLAGWRCEVNRPAQKQV